MHSWWAALPGLYQHVNDPTGIAQTTVASAHAFGRPPGIDTTHLSHFTPYGTFRQDMNERLVIETDIAA
jgi:hypothetical protein